MRDLWVLWISGASGNIGLMMMAGWIHAPMILALVLVFISITSLAWLAAGMEDLSPAPGWSEGVCAKSVTHDDCQTPKGSGSRDDGTGSDS